MLEKRNFTQGMNRDYEDRHIEDGESRYNLNVRIGSSDDDSVGVVENTKGNSLVDFQLPPGFNTVIGTLDDKTSNRAFYFVDNSLGNDQIYRYTASTNLIEQVLVSSLLNLSTQYLITGITLVEGDLLGWTDDLNPPRKINVATALAGDYDLSTQEFMDAVKYPPICEPVIELGIEVSTKINLIENKIFQHKTRFYFDDDEKSAYSPISTIALPTTDCGGENGSTLDNFADITFATGSKIVVKIELAVREGNIGDFTTEIVLDKAKEGIADNTETTYRFRNDKLRSGINLKESIQLFDNVPLLAKAEEIIDGNKKVYGNILEGYDAVDVDTEFGVEYSAIPEEEGDTYTVRGSIYIKNIYANNFELREYQPIHQKDSNNTFPVFGGLAGTAIVGGTVQEVGDEGGGYVQACKLAGFPVYLAGTDHSTVSKQAIIGSPIDGNLNQDSMTGVFFTNKGGERVALRKEMNAGNVFSNFEIKNVPNGKYKLRIASHLVEQEDLDSGKRDFHKTSTNVVLCGGAQWYEYEFEVNGGDVTVGQTWIIDHSDVRLGSGSAGLFGYIVDKDNPGTSLQEQLDDTRIHLSEIKIGQSVFNGDPSSPFASVATSGWNIIIAAAGDVTKFWQLGDDAYAYTDHNGFFHWSSSTQGNMGRIVLDEVRSGSRELDPSSKFLNGIDFFDGSTLNFGDYPAFLSSQMKGGVWRNQNNDVQSLSRTFIKGAIKDSLGSGIEDLSVVARKGGNALTDGDGVYRIRQYIDTWNWRNTGTGDENRSMLVCFYVLGACFAAFDNQFLSIGTKTIGSNDFNNTDPNNEQVWVLVSDVEVIILTSGSGYGWKRKSITDVAIVYYDRANRSGTGNRTEDMKIEPVWFNETPNEEGAAAISWKIKHQPPDWATHYQWVRTLNAESNRYLQWVAKDIEYVDDDGTVVNQISATQIKIDLDNLFTDYKERNKDSQVTYDVAVNDRLRLIKDGNGVFYTDYIDVKVKGTDGQFVFLENSSALPILEVGVAFELYTPKLDVEEAIYYEFGECYLIGNSGQPNRFHEGLDSNQDPNNLSSSPATGVFKTGNTYIRLRKIKISTGFKIVTVEDERISDFFASKSQSIGRPNRVDPDTKQVRRSTVIYYSETFIPQTNVNGLSKFFDDAFEEYDRNFGSIQKLFSNNKRLLCLQELKTGQIFVNSDILLSETGDASVLQSSAVLSKINYYVGDFGIGTHPESFADYGSWRFWVDIPRGAVLRLAQDGITPISEYRMHNYFTDSFDQIQNSAAGTKVIGTWHQKFGEYVISFDFTQLIDIGFVFAESGQLLLCPTGATLPFFTGKTEIELVVNGGQSQVYTITAQTVNIIPTKFFVDIPIPSEGLLSVQVVSRAGQTVAFNNTLKKWSTFYSYTPEFFVTSGTGILSFKDGKLWVHNVNPIYNNFFGEQFFSEITPISNENKGNMKFFQSLQVQANDKWFMPFATTQPNVDQPLGQETELNEDDFENKEGWFYAAFWMDVNTPNKTNPLFEGDVMRSYAMVIRLRNTKTVLQKLNQVGIHYELSELSNR